MEKGEGGVNGNGESGRETGVKIGESGGRGGGRRRGILPGGGVGAGMSANSGRLRMKSVTLHGSSQRSLSSNVVGLAGQSKRWATVCEPRLQ